MKEADLLKLIKLATELGYYDDVDYWQYKLDRLRGS